MSSQNGSAPQPAEPLTILPVAVFVIDFNLHSGNSILFQYPQDVELPFVEFKAMPSGSHHVLQDTSYTFLGEGMFAVSCFEAVLDDSAQRGLKGARSVGLVMSAPHTLSHHIPFLRQQVQIQLTIPDNRDFFELKNYFDIQLEEHKSINPILEMSCVEVHMPIFDLKSPVARISDTIFQKYYVPFREGAVTHLMETFGQNIMKLWKLVVLRKRIIILCHPPIREACETVFALWCIAAHTIPQITSQPRPFFFQNVSDIPYLSTQSNYICCVTETVFELKTQLFDAFISPDGKIKVNEDVKPVVKLTSSDKRRYKELQQAPDDVKYREDSLGQNIPEEYAALRYFIELNNRIFGALSAAQQRPEHVIVKADLNTVGLVPSDDRAFLTRMAAEYCPSLDVEAMGSCACA